MATTTITTITSHLRYPLLLALIALNLLILVGMRPDALPFPPNVDYSDAAISHYANALYLQRSIRANEFPLWRPLLMSGQPFAANPLNKVWYPLQWFAVLLPPALHLNLLIWLHLIIAGMGMRALAREIGLEAGIAEVIGIAYMLTPRLIAGIGAGHLDVVYAMAWSPCVLWALYRTITGEQRWRNAAILALLASLCLLADMRAFVVVMFAAVGIGILALTRIPQRDRIKALFACACAGILLIGLTAVQWLPLLEIAPELSRNGLTQSDSAIFSLEFPQLIAVLFPVGSHETLLYTGLMVQIMFIIGTMTSWRRRNRLIVIIGWLLILFAAWYALGINGLLWRELTTLIPPLLWLRVPPRMWWIAVIALLLLAGFGLQALNTPRRRRFVVVLSLILIGELLIADLRLLRFLPQDRWLDRYAPIAEALIADGVTKFYSPTYSLPQQAAAYWNIPDFGGIDPFQLQRYLPEFEAATGTRITQYTVTLPPYGSDLATSNREAQIDAARLARWGVSHVLAAYEIANPDLQLVTEIDGVYIYRNRLTAGGVSASATMPETMCVGALWCYQPRTLLPAVAISALSLIGVAALLLWSKRRS